MIPPRPGPRPAAAQHALALALFTALALVYFRPVWRTFAGHIAPDLGDPVFVLWVLKWGAHCLRDGLAGLWDAPIFFPARSTLAYSEHLLGPAAIVAALNAAGADAIVVYNLLLVGSFVLCGWSAWYVLARSGLPPAAALFGGVAWAFSPFRGEQLSHLQILLAALVPPLLWTWDRLLAERSWRRAGRFLALYLLHLTGSAYLAYMVHVPLAALLANRLPALRREGLDRRSRRVLAAVAAIAAAGAAAAFLPYWLTWRELGVARAPSGLHDLGASAVSYLTPWDRNWYGPLWPGPLRRGENSLFAGVLPTALAAWALMELWRQRRARAPAERPPARRRIAVLACAGLAAAGWLLGELTTWWRAPLHPRLAGFLPGGDYDLPTALFLLGAGGLLALRLRRRRQAPPAAARWPLWWRGLLLSGALCLALAQPFVYQPAALLLPGLGTMRVPARFHVLVSLAVAALAALGLAGLLARLRTPRARRLAGALAVALLAFELLPRQLAWPELRREAEFPPVYTWLAGRADVRALLELPWRAPGPTPELRDIPIMYLGTRHWRPLVNGYSGYFPEHYQWLRQRCCWPVPQGEALAALRRWGVTHVLVHRRELLRGQRRALRRWEGTAGVRRVYDRDGDLVFRLAPSAGSGGAPPPARSRPAPAPGGAAAPR